MSKQGVIDWSRVASDMERAADKAEREEPGWKEDAISAIAEYAAHGSEFTSEQVGIRVPDGADRRALGSVFREAEKRGIVERVGVTRDKWGSHKALWRKVAKP